MAMTGGHGHLQLSHTIGLTSLGPGGRQYTQERTLVSSLPMRHGNGQAPDDLYDVRKAAGACFVALLRSPGLIASRIRFLTRAFPSSRR